MPNWTTAICSANGIDIHYRRTGGDKPPLVLLHGLTGDGACWSPLARALESDFDVIMPDARGHGESSKPLDGYTYEDHARDVIELIELLELAAPILLGHSMGGMTAAVVASQMPLRALVLADPTFLSPDRQCEVYESDAAEQHRQLLSLDRETVLAQARTRHAHRLPEIVERVAEARMNTSIHAYDVLTPPNPDYRRLISAIAAPILLIIADNGVISLEMAHELQNLNTHLQVEQLQNAGHGLHYDQPDNFATLVASFLHALPAS